MYSENKKSEIKINDSSFLVVDGMERPNRWLSDSLTKLSVGLRDGTISVDGKDGSSGVVDGRLVVILWYLLDEAGREKIDGITGVVVDDANWDGDNNLWGSWSWLQNFVDSAMVVLKGITFIGAACGAICCSGAQVFPVAVSTTGVVGVCFGLTEVKRAVLWGSLEHVD